jgi:hypothetical protein
VGLDPENRGKRETFCDSQGPSADGPRLSPSAACLGPTAKNANGRIYIGFDKNGVIEAEKN